MGNTLFDAVANRPLSELIQIIDEANNEINESTLIHEICMYYYSEVTVAHVVELVLLASNMLCDHVRDMINDKET